MIAIDATAQRTVSARLGMRPPAQTPSNHDVEALIHFFAQEGAGTE